MDEKKFTLHSLYNGKISIKFFEESHQYWVTVGGDKAKRKKGVTTILGIKDKSVALMSWQQDQIAGKLIPIVKSGKKLTEENVVQAIFAADTAKNEAADLGKLVHAWVESYIRHRLKEKGHKEMPEMPEDKNVLQGVTSFLEWEAQHKVKFLWAEKVLYSLKHDYIGQADFGAIVDGIICLCDLKSGNGLYNSVRMQTSAYAKADTEESGFKYEGRWAIRVAKETEKEYLARLEFKNEIKRFLGKTEKAVDLYQVFEAKFLDSEKGNMQRDFDAFLNCLELGKWDSETDFWKEKVAAQKGSSS